MCLYCNPPSTVRRRGQIAGTEPLSNDWGFLVTHKPAITFNWQFTTPQCSNDTFVNAGTSTNEAYISLATPAGARFHSVVHLACHDIDTATEAESFAKLWAKFSALTVKTWNDLELYYYKSNVVWADGATTVPELLASKNGQCGSWNQLLEEAIKINGLTNSQPIKVTTTNGNGFLVKDWSWVDPPHTNHPAFGDLYDFAYATTNAAAAVTMVPVPTDALYGEVTYLGGSGQNNIWPAEARFGSHYILLRDGVYYDPSYGSTYTSELVFQGQSVFGIRRIRTLFGAPRPGGLEMQFTNSASSFKIPSP